MEITNLQLPVVSIYHGNGPITLMLMLNWIELLATYQKNDSLIE